MSPTGQERQTGRRGRYTYQVVDLRTGAVLDELPLSGVSFATLLNEVGELRGQLVLGDPRITVRTPRAVTEPGRTALYVDRDGVLVWGGIIWTTRYSSVDRMLEIGAAGFWSYYDHRRVLPSDYDPLGSDLSSASVSFADEDQGRIVQELVELAGRHPGGDIGMLVQQGQYAGIHRNITYPGTDLKSVGDALRDLTSLTDGPDVLFDCLYDAQGRPVPRLRVGSPALGQLGSPHVWEYGANLVEYSWPKDAAGMANRVFALGATLETSETERTDEASTLVAVPDPPPKQLVAVACDPSSAWPLTESEESHLDLADQGLLQSLADSALEASGSPVVLPELTVRADREPCLGSYQVGDWALIVLQDHYFPEGRQFTVRIVGIEVTPGDDAGEELVKLTVTPLTEARS